MSKDNGLRYRRNWIYEQMAEVHFIDGHYEQLFCSTDNKGRISELKVGDKYVTPDEFGAFGITEVHFMTPAKLEVKTPTDVLVKTYLQLGKKISEGDTMDKCRIRSEIADEIYRRGENLHDLMAQVN